ncbi:MAG: endoribonuclease MazF [Deltaproteobacteria bacterium]|nr:MAG: endoribonuclease MazF [Deltaproteobacteria bacterium]
MTAPYIPERGDVVWLDFHPQTGHEQRGRRPAVVLSPHTYNGKVGLALFCPISSRIKGYPFEVPVPADCGVTGVVLADHVKNLDWRARRAEFICRLPNQVITDILAKLAVLIT